LAFVFVGIYNNIVKINFEKGKNIYWSRS